MSFTINSTVPNDGVTEVALDNNIIFNFSDEVSVVSGKNITITDGTTSETVAVTDANITHTGTNKSVNVFGEEVVLDSNGQGFLTTPFNITRDFTQSYIDGVFGNGGLITWQNAQESLGAGQTFVDGLTTGMKSRYIAQYNLPSDSTDSEVQAVILNVLNSTYASIPFYSTNNDLTAVTLPYVDPTHYLIEINLPSGTKPQYSGANSATRTNDVTWRLSYCSTANDANTIVSTVLSGIIEHNVLKILPISPDNGSNSIWYSVSLSNYGNPFVGTNNLLLLSNQITYNPTNNFSLGSQYTVQVEVGAFKNFSNNTNTSYSFSFTSLNTVTPVLSPVLSPVLEIPLILQKTYPLNDSIDNAFDTKNIIFEFSKAIYPKRRGIILLQTNNKTIEFIDVNDSKKISGNGTNKIIISPETNFEPFTKYDIVISNTSYYDYTGVTLSFTTNNSILPTLLSHVPEQNALNVSKTQSIILRFSEPIYIDPSGSVILYNFFNNKTSNTFNLESDEIIGSGTNQITIKSNKNLLSKQKYYLLIASNTFHNDTNNFYQGITDKNTFVFKTGL